MTSGTWSSSRQGTRNKSIHIKNKLANIPAKTYIYLRASYLRQLDRRRPLLPVGCEIRVYSDPGGERVGDGGSTLHILNAMVSRI